MDKNSNAGRFIAAYNRLDKGLRDIYNLKPALSFTDVVRRTTAINPIVKKYEDDLVDYGRLRNAIIHRSSEEPIAEPHDDVVEKFESIARSVTSPPTVIQTVGSKNVFVAKGDVSLRKLLPEMYTNGYSNIPVYLESTLVGVVTRKMIIDALGQAISSGKNIEKVLDDKIVHSLNLLDVSAHYEVVSSTTTIDSILYMFNQNRKLTTVIITENGTYTEKPLGIVVTVDVLDMQTILDNY